MSVANIVILTDANFPEEVLQSPVPVLVDFWAEWCGPCKMVSPILDELAGEYDGKVKIAKVNIDEFQGLATQYGIRAIPTLLIFKTAKSRTKSWGCGASAISKPSSIEFRPRLSGPPPEKWRLSLPRGSLLNGRTLPSAQPTC